MELGSTCHDLRVLAVVGLADRVVVELTVRVELGVVELGIAQLGQDLFAEASAALSHGREHAVARISEVTGAHEASVG